jgi:hypothetical protein
MVLISQSRKQKNVTLQKEFPARTWPIADVKLSTGSMTASGLGCVKTPAKPDGGENLSSFPKV